MHFKELEMHLKCILGTNAFGGNAFEINALFSYAFYLESIQKINAFEMHFGELKRHLKCIFAINAFGKIHLKNA